MENPLISYAQNFEDVILHRIFKDVSEGFYIDVGACHPLYDSVTKHFYDCGWSGINIEPVVESIELFRKERVRDINLQCALGRESDSMKLAVPQSSANSTLVREYQENLKASDAGCFETNVTVLSLNDIWQKYVGVKNVNFVKIDVEGFEREVLLGCDFELVKPEVFVIESTVPNTPIKCSDQWDHLLEAHYEYFYFDGLNNYYIRKGHSLDVSEMAVQPNPFDEYIKYDLLKAQRDIESLQQTIRMLQQSQQQAKLALEDAYQTIERKDQELRDLYNSRKA